MKSFKKYLIESQQTYDFKIKIAGDCPDNCDDKIKAALVRYNPSSCTQKTRTPIQETHVDFPEHKNVSVTIFDVSLDYPATSPQIRSIVSSAIGISESCIRVRSTLEEAEIELNHQYDELTGQPLLITPYEKSNNQKVVGEQRVTNLLKELGQSRVEPAQYKGVNDQILAKKSYREKVAKTNAQINTTSPIGSRSIKLPTPGV